MLIAQDLSKAYADIVAVTGITLSLARAEVVGLLGPSGAGKTTIFKMLIGIEQPTGGRIVLNGEDITALPIHNRARLGLGYLPQGPSLIRSLTVEQNLVLALETRVSNSSQRRTLAGKLLNVFSLEHVRNTWPSRISGGERRRCEIARAMANQPTFLLLDEPFAGLDPLGIEDVCSIITLVKSWGVGILITDHNARETLRLADRTYFVDGGSIRRRGDARSISCDPAIRQGYLGDGFSL